MNIAFVIGFHDLPEETYGSLRDEITQAWIHLPLTFQL